MPSSPSFSFAVLADTHWRSAPEDPQAAYPSDALHNARNREVLRLLRARSPSFAVHLGDVTHTLPALPSHEPTLRQAAAHYRGLPFAVMVAPGNHDVGDKPGSAATAAATDEASHQAFERVFGPPWRSFDHAGCRFLLLDAPLMGTGLDMEHAQWAWLERALAGCQRSFIFLHYPPFLLRPDEPEHYDNLPLAARRRLLALLRQHRVEALFSGHVHGFFHDRHGETELYVLPSVAFQRPEYAELHPVAPADENGRNDPAKLGFFMVHVRDGGHDVELLRTGLADGAALHPPGKAPLGLWLRGGWARQVDLPCGDLDEFTCKRARNDWPLLALWDMGVHRLRLPLADLADDELRARALRLVDRGARLLVFSAGVPGPAQLALLGQLAGIAQGWELLARPDQLAAATAAAAASPVPVALSVIGGELAPGGRGYFSHFPTQGFTPAHPALPALPDPLPACLTQLVFRVPDGEEIWQGLAAAKGRAAELGLQALCHVELPRGTELHPQLDDLAVARRVAVACLAAAAWPTVPAYLDLLQDKDRGYHPRNGLLDRRSNPRPAARVLRCLAHLLAGQAVHRSAAGRLGFGRWELVLRPEGQARWWDLVMDRGCHDAPAGPALREI